MAPLFYLINTALTICIYIVTLRLWMQFTQVNFYNPLTQIVIKITQPIIGPLRKVIPSIGRIDTATCLVIYLLALGKFIYIVYNLPINLPIFHFKYLLYAFYVIAYTTGHLIFWLLLFRAILSWVSRGQSLVEEALFQLTEPLIAPIRKIVPPIGGIDLSFMIFVFILMLLNMLALQLLNPWWGIISI